jgi:hypothetical protein
VAHFGNSLAFPGGCSHLRLAADSPVLPGTRSVAVEPQAQTIHSANPQRISEMGHYLTTAGGPVRARTITSGWYPT